MSLPGRLVNRSATQTLRAPSHWPWQDASTHALWDLRALVLAVTWFPGCALGAAADEPHHCADNPPTIRAPGRPRPSSGCVLGSATRTSPVQPPCHRQAVAWPWAVDRGSGPLLVELGDERATASQGAERFDLGGIADHHEHVAALHPGLRWGVGADLFARMAQGED